MDGSKGLRRRFLKRESDDIVMHSLLDGQVGVYSNRSPAKATPNEDAAAFIQLGPDAAVLIVADGVGGIRGGEFASRIAIETILEQFSRPESRDHRLRTIILDGIDAANARILERGSGAATTLCVAEIQGGEVRTYHVGDSMTLIVGQRGKIKHQTVCHSPVGFAVESGILAEDEAMFHEHRHLVSNVVGSTDMRIEMGPAVKLAARDTVLLASDGLFDNLATEEVVEAIRKGQLEKSLRRMLAETRFRMESPSSAKPSKADDLTVVAFRPWRPAPRSGPATTPAPAETTRTSLAPPEPAHPALPSTKPSTKLPSSSVPASMAADFPQNLEPQLSADPRQPVASGNSLPPQTPPGAHSSPSARTADETPEARDDTAITSRAPTDPMTIDQLDQPLHQAFERLPGDESLSTSSSQPVPAELHRAPYPAAFADQPNAVNQTVDSFPPVEPPPAEPPPAVETRESESQVADPAAPKAGSIRRRNLLPFWIRNGFDS